MSLQMLGTPCSCGIGWPLDGFFHNTCTDPVHGERFLFFWSFQLPFPYKKVAIFKGCSYENVLLHCLAHLAQSKAGQAVFSVRYGVGAAHGSELPGSVPSLQGICTAQHSLKAVLDVQQVQHCTGLHLLRSTDTRITSSLMYSGHPVSGSLQVSVLDSDCVKANVSLRQLSFSAEDGCNEMRAITKLFLKIQLTLLNCQSSRIDAVLLQKCYQFKLLQGKKKKG